MSISDKCLVCPPSLRPICTRCCLTMTNMIQVCSNLYVADPYARVRLQEGHTPLLRRDLLLRNPLPHRLVHPPPGHSSSLPPQNPCVCERERERERECVCVWRERRSEGWRESAQSSSPSPGPSAAWSFLLLRLCRGIPGAVLEPLVRFWSHFVGIYRQNLTRSLEN